VTQGEDPTYSPLPRPAISAYISWVEVVGVQGPRESHELRRATSTKKRNNEIDDCCTI